MAQYLSKEVISQLDEMRKQIFAIREKAYNAFKVDILDTDGLSSLSIFKIVSQYDPDYNINFSRNGEDAKSGTVLIEQKASKVASPLNKKGKVRKNADRNAVFMFHAMGDLQHSRYIFVARNKDTLDILRLYDIASKDNCDKVYNELLRQRNLWLDAGRADPSKMKRDVIFVGEPFILNNLVLNPVMNVDACKVFKDW